MAALAKSLALSNEEMTIPISSCSPFYPEYQTISYSSSAPGYVLLKGPEGAKGMEERRYTASNILRRRMTYEEYEEHQAGKPLSKFVIKPKQSWIQRFLAVLKR